MIRDSGESGKFRV
jgi:hypothetical protein